MYRFKNVALVVALVLAAISPAYAQSTAQITGTITDTSGSVIPGATVVITNEATSIQTTAVSNAVGTYTALFLQPGSYRIDVALDGFRPLSRSGIRLQVAQAAQLNFQMEVGALTETVTVVQTAPLLDTSTNAMGGVVTTDQIENLPVKGRNSNAFMMLAPGVRVPRVTMNQPVLESHFQFFSVNGANPRQNAFVLDGGNNNDVGFNGPEYSPQVDAVQEMRVQTNNYSAEYANVAGGVINVVTKAGTNEYHGSAFEYIRDHRLQENSFFNKRDGLEKSPMRINQFGGNVRRAHSAEQNILLFRFRSKPDTTAGRRIDDRRWSSNSYHCANGTAKSRRFFANVHQHRRAGDDLRSDDNQAGSEQSGEISPGSISRQPHSSQPHQPDRGEHPEALPASEKRW